MLLSSIFPRCIDDLQGRWGGVSGTRLLCAQAVQRPEWLPKWNVFYPGPAAPGKRSLGFAAGTPCTGTFMVGTRWKTCSFPFQNLELSGLLHNLQTHRLKAAQQEINFLKNNKKKTIHQPHLLPRTALGPNPVQLAMQHLQPPPGVKLSPPDLRQGRFIVVLQLRGPEQPNPDAAVCRIYSGPSSFLLLPLPWLG